MLKSRMGGICKSGSVRAVRVIELLNNRGIKL